MLEKSGKFVSPHQSGSGSDFAHDVTGNWVLYQISSEVASEIAFTWCGYNVKLYKNQIKRGRFRLVWLDHLPHQGTHPTLR